MKHQKYKRRRRPILDTVRRFFNIGARWIVRNPKHTKNDPPRLAEIFALKRE